MIFWADEGMILAARSHGESAVILEVLTAEHGRHAGVVRGGASRKMRPVLQPGAQVALEWQARLEDHIGSFRVEAKRSRAAAIMGDRMALEALGSLAGLLSIALPEREPAPELYQRTMLLADGFGARDDWLEAYARWELALLSDLGFALDLGACAVTGAREGLCFVSPKSGRAVTRQGAGAWADRLLPLPGFLHEDTGAPVSFDDIRDALRLTGYFLEHQVVAASSKGELPAARRRLVDVIERKMRDG